MNHVSAQLFGAMLMLAVALPAPASTITIGSLTSSDDGSTEIIHDSLNGLDWLRWDVLADLDYAQTLEAIGPGGAYEGWSLAHNAEAQMFIDALIGTPNDCTVNNGGFCRPKAYSFSLLGFGSLVGDSSLPNATDFTSDIAWFYNDLSQSTPVGYIALWERFNSSILQFTSDVEKQNQAYTIPLTDAFSSSGQFSEMPIGWLLYRPAQVPEPGLFTLFALGLLGLGLATRTSKG